MSADRVVLGSEPKKSLEVMQRPASYAVRAWPQILARLRKARYVSILLDFDGTLVRLEKRPEDVRVPNSVGEALTRLIGTKNVRVAIVSGRRVAELHNLLPFAGLKYYGVHGVESDSGQVIAPGPETRVALRSVKRLARVELGSLPGILIEDKGLGFAVHYRLTTQKIKSMAGIRLRAIVAAWSKRLHILDGKKVWEVLPIEVTGKSLGVRHSRSGKWKDALVIYIGDDHSDEEAFRHLPHAANAVTIRVGAKSHTAARYYLRGPGEVLHFLVRLGEFFESRTA
jgi:trehalose 6-phosphate phosphatase